MLKLGSGSALAHYGNHDIALEIIFDSHCIAQGDSGGPLFDEHWRIIGMIITDQNHGSKSGYGTNRFHHKDAGKLEDTRGPRTQ